MEHGGVWFFFNISGLKNRMGMHHSTFGSHRSWVLSLTSVRRLPMQDVVVRFVYRKLGHFLAAVRQNRKFGSKFSKFFVKFSVGRISRFGSFPQKSKFFGQYLQILRKFWSPSRKLVSSYVSSLAVSPGTEISVKIFRILDSSAFFIFHRGDFLPKFSKLGDFFWILNEVSGVRR